MSNNLKLDLNISPKEIEKMAKQVIREIIESQIEKVMANIDIQKVVDDKLNQSGIKISKTINDEVKKRVGDLEWKLRGQFNQTMREIVLNEVQKKPLSGNVYLKIDGSNVETDYDY